MINAGVDIGGTNIKVALVDTAGELPVVIESIGFPFAGMDPRALCERIGSGIRELAERLGPDTHAPQRIGVTVPGSLSSDGRTIVHAYNLGYHDVPFADMLSEQFPDTPVNLMNDAKAAALAELKAGSLKGCRTALMLTLGTGLGGGLILGGEVFNGGLGRGSEPGHVPFAKGGILCGCGQRGCAERYTSATRLAELGRERLGEDYADAKAVKDAAEAGNAAAQEILDEYIDDLATLVAGFCNLLDPERVSIGGGFSASGDILFVPLRRLVAEKTFGHVYYEIVPARFLNNAGVIGAAYL